ncbi:acyl carrier protein [Myxococcaceae bacterium JPH2]|nr:acyl carrier protein [Myxococcaceae bacterium JPH2]
MHAERTLQRLKQMIADLCAVDAQSIRGEGMLRGYGLDSIRIMDLVATIESEFQVQLRVEEMGTISSVRDLAEHIDRVIARNAPVEAAATR